MLQQNNPIHLALAFDQNFLTPFYVVLTSIFENNANNKFVFHTIAAGVDSAERAKISSFIEQHNSEIFYYEVDKKLVQKFVLPEYSHVSEATYYRLFLLEMIPPTVEKLLYIDTDIVVIGDLTELYNTNINTVPLAAVVDPKIKNRPELGIITEGTYFNAGVLLINLKLWNSQKISEKAIRYLGENSERIIFHDQDALNAVLMNNWLPVGHKYNLTFYDFPEYLPKKHFDEYLKDKVIVHYTTQNKPWMLSCTNRLKFLYHQYLQRSPHAGQGTFTDMVAGKKPWKRMVRSKVKEFLIDNTRFFKVLGKDTSMPE